MNTTLTKTAEAAELLAASLLINELCKKVDTVGNKPALINPYDVIIQYREMIDTLANVVAATFKPAEA